MPIEVARQLRKRGIEAVTARDQGLLGASDEVHLTRAVENGFVFCTYDSDYLEMVASGIDHAGIVFAQQDIHYIGDWVRWLSLMHAVYRCADMRNRVEFI